MTASRVALLAVLASAAVSLAADKPAVTEDKYWLKPIVVTATRSEQELTNVAANVAVLLEPEIRRSAAQTLDGLLRQIPGLSTLRQSSSLTSAPIAQGVSLRGLGATTASRTLVMVDGVPITDPFGGWVALNRVPLENIERVEVVRGGGSGIWGNLAMGGVVNIIMRKPVERTFSFMSDNGDERTTSSSLFAADRIGSVLVSGGGRYFDTDGFIVTREDLIGPVDEPAGIRHGTAFGRVEVLISDRSSIYLDGSYYDEEKRKGTPGDMSGTIARRVGAGADLETAGGGAFDINVYVEGQTYDNYSSSISRDRTESTPSTWEFEVPSKSGGANLQWSRRFGEHHHLFAGGDYRYIDSKSSEYEGYDGKLGVFRNLAEIGGKQHLAGAYLQEIFSPGGRWTVALAARLDHIRNSDGFQRETEIETGVIESEEEYGSAATTVFNPTIGLVLHASERLSFRGSAYQGFRAPTVNELYRRSTARGNVVNSPNPALEPERLIGGEAGIDYKLGARFFGRLTAFWNEVDKTIAQRTIGTADADGDTIEPCGWVAAEGVCRQRDNIGRLLTAGIETELAFRPYPLWSFSVSHIFDHTEILESDDPELVGKRQRQTPKNQFVLRAA
ncbi:MAG: TonB-dependent receptor, partial [Candidatus Latescibacterota bacterium]